MLQKLKADPLSIVDDAKIDASQKQLVKSANKIKNDPLQMVIDSDKCPQDYKKNFKLAKKVKTDPAAVLEELDASKD